MIRPRLEGRGPEAQSGEGTHTEPHSSMAGE